MTIADHMIDSLMVECDDLRDRITELEDENAKLDRRRRSLQADVERLGGIIHRQRKELSTMQYTIECRNDENAKLRELVRHLYDYRESYFRTGIYPTDHGMIERCMRELGIEVKDEDEG